MDIDKKILFEDYKIFKITEETRKNVLKHSDIHTSCPLKIRMGKFYTDDEYKQKAEESLNRQLPGEEKSVKRLIFKRRK